MLNSKPIALPTINPYFQGGRQTGVTVRQFKKWCKSQTEVDYEEITGKNAGLRITVNGTIVVTIPTRQLSNPLAGSVMARMVQLLNEGKPTNERVTEQSLVTAIKK